MAPYLKHLSARALGVLMASSFLALVAIMLVVTYVYVDTPPSPSYLVPIHSWPVEA